MQEKLQDKDSARRASSKPPKNAPKSPANSFTCPSNGGPIPPMTMLEHAGKPSRPAAAIALVSSS
jgi:hypothetical protein